MSNPRFDHIHLRSPDPEAAADFYVRHFGATITGRVQAGPRLRVMVALAGVPLFIEEVPADTAAPPPPPFLGLEHLGLAVDDLAGELDRLRAAGVEIISGPTIPRPGVTIAFLQAPDGVQVELIERR
jgi:catechol 2,3-dioxygenase-like lactoylglutathione lyase family enzyme